MQNLSWGPNDLPFHILRSNNLFSKSLSTLSIIDLGELEDLYYATCGKLKELLGQVNLHLFNKFKAPEDHYFTYTSKAYKHLGPITVEKFKAFLLAQEKILYNDGILKMMNKAVRSKKKGEAMKTNSQNRINNYNVISPSEQRSFSSSYDRFKYGSDWQRDTEGLRDIREISCGMIFGELAEKYRPTIHKEQLEDLQKKLFNVNHNTFTEQDENQSDSHTRYVSPYNLEERAKKLNIPGGAEMPCICDPECICAPLCAGDLTQNCLCEENGLFCRVTEGWNIDDLDVPDLENDKKLVSSDGLTQETDSGDEHAKTETPSAILKAPISKPVREYESHLSQHKLSDITSPKPQAYSYTITPIPQCGGSLSIWATPSNLGSRQSPLWQTLHRVSSGSCPPPNGTRKSMLASFSSRGDKSASVQRQSRFPSARRFLDLCRRDSKNRRDVLQMIRMPDNEEGRTNRINAQVKQEIGFNGFTYIVRGLF